MNLIDYFGKFHPLAVHLPIGILSIFLVLGFFVSRKELNNAVAIIRIMLLVSALTASLSAITGFILMSSGSYTGNLMTGHQILGFALTFINWLVFFKIKYLLHAKVPVYRGSLFLLLILMMLTGHAGGSLTHGEDFLTPPPPSQWFVSWPVEEIEISPDSKAYDAVAQIVQQKCVSCHGKNKQKGGLRMDTQSSMLAGGKSGSLFDGNDDAGLLIQRITLPLDDEEHMPPKERKQLTKSELDFIIWWVEAGSNFDNTLLELDFPDSLHGILTQKVVADILIPEADVEKADEAAIDRLRALGVVVQPVARDVSYLSANFVNVLNHELSDAITELPKIEKQLISLNIDNQQLDQASWIAVGMLSSLRKLHAGNTSLDDAQIRHLQSLKNLVTINVVGTAITLSGLKQLEGLENLRNIYLYQTGVSTSDFSSLQKLFPRAAIDTGNYQVPILESDTTVFTLP
jgi:mono/diheme cytochrome c family protein